MPSLKRIPLDIVNGGCGSGKHPTYRKRCFSSPEPCPCPAKIHQKQKQIDGTPVPSCYMQGETRTCKPWKKACDSWQSKNNFGRTIVSQTIPALSTLGNSTISVWPYFSTSTAVEQCFIRRLPTTSQSLLIYLERKCPIAVREESPEKRFTLDMAVISGRISAVKNLSSPLERPQGLAPLLPYLGTAKQKIQRQLKTRCVESPSPEP